MKHLNAVITLFMVFGLLAVVPTQAQERVIVTDVPFDFAVGDRVLPSGSYRIAPIANSFQVLIDGESCFQVAGAAASETLTSRS